LLMPLAASAEYIVNDKSATLAAGQGLFQYALPIDFHRNLLDVEECRTFTEIICASWTDQYVLGVALTVSETEISKVYVIETSEGDWNFGAADYLKRSSQQEDWSLIPEGERLTRTQLDEEGARLYFAYWTDKRIDIAPWGDPCSRLEGGKGGAADIALSDEWQGDMMQFGSCTIGCPDLALNVRESLVDPDYGMAVLLLSFGGADSHLFRIEKDESLIPRTGFGYGYRYVHTLTVQ
jgi:hypothetical protein